MKFTLSTSSPIYKNEKDIEALKSIGFTFKPLRNKEFLIVGDPLIEINTLEDMVEFTNKYGRIILDETYIEIYNDYRE